MIAVKATYYLRLLALLVGGVFLALTGANTADAGPAKCPDNDPKTRCIDQNKPFMIREFELQGPGVLKAFTLAGNIEVTSIPDTEKVRIELYVDRGYAFWADSKNLDNYRITMIQRGNEVMASVENKSKSTGLFSDPITFSYKIYAPASVSAELKTSGGHIIMNGLKGSHLVKTSGGNIRAINTTGMLRAYTAGGNIDIDSSRGMIYAQTDGGNIIIDESKGEFRLKTNGGWITAERVSGSMLAQVGGGDIRAHFLHVAEGINLETSAGDIVLEVPAAVGYELVLMGSEVNIPDSDLFEGIYRTTRVEGSYHHGGVPISLHTSHGTVTLKTYR